MAAVSNKNVVCLVTGASRGIGRQISLEVARHVGPDSCMLLTARDEQKLAETAAAVAQLNPDVQVVTLLCELARVDERLTEFESKLRGFAADDGLRKFDVAIVFHNAGSIGDNSLPASAMRDFNQMNEHMKANVTSMIALNSVFLSTVGNPRTAKMTMVVNLTTVCVVEGFRSMAQYTTAKAAREGFLRVLAVEEPLCRVLNYSPGPIETDLIDTVLSNTYSEDIHELYSDLRQQKNMVSAEESISKLMEILDANEFESGARVDYYELDACDAAEG